MAIQVPFAYGNTVTGEAFINRKAEIKRLKTNFESHVNTMIVSPRRWGKSSLVKKVAHELKGRKDILVCYIDLYAVRTEAELLTLFARELVKQTSSQWQDWGDAVKTFVKNAVPKISFGTLNMQTDLELNWAQQKLDPLAIYQIPESVAEQKKVKLVVCLDEFQNVAYLEDPLAVQKQMRSVWQHHQSVSYCLFGSKKHWLTDIFTNYSMPFYRFGDLMYLEKIEGTHWEKFIDEQFERTGKKISTEIIKKITAAVSLHPQYIQQLAQRVWMYTDDEATEESFQQGVDSLLTDTSMAFNATVDSLTATQLNFLKAYCRGVREFSSSETLRTYHLGAASNVVRIKAALEQKDVMDFLNKEPEFVDPVFELWFRKNFL